MKTYWNFEFDGEMHEWECDTKEIAETSAHEWFGERNSEETGTVEDDGFLVELNYDVEGDAEEVKREKIALEYEYYHGDYEEHNVMWNAL